MSRRRPRARISHDRWLVSYADFITLLFAFFVVLYAFAKADQKKHVQITRSIDEAFRSFGVFSAAGQSNEQNHGTAGGSDAGSANNQVVMQERVVSPEHVKADLERIRQDLEQSLSSQLSTHSVALHMSRDGLVISLREAGFFASGSATPKAESLPTIKRIAASLRNMPYDLRIEGHTDNIPIHTAEFDSNWELSAARATRMARLFNGLEALPPERIAASGYAEFHPTASNATAEGRAENRRVDLIVLPRTQMDLAAIATNKRGGVWRKITDEP